VTELELLASGRDADVFALDAERILRRYRGDGDVTAEAAVMVYVDGLGFPVPRVYSAEGTDLTLERLTGPTMLHALGAGQMSAVTGAELLADLHERLHSLPPRTPHKPGDRVLHLDLHPANVILEARGPVVIDWRNASQGPPELDLAVSALILARVAVDSTHEATAVADGFLPVFLASVGPIPSEALDQAARLRRADSNTTTREIDLLGEAISAIGEYQAGSPP
jgi:aminoglycoside phosphotransferase (APT) family kinase protein